MEETRRKTNLLLFVLLYVSPLFKATNIEEIAHKYKGGEVKILAFQVIDFKAVSKIFI